MIPTTTPNHVLDLAPGTAMQELTGSAPALREVGGAELRAMLRGVYGALAEAERTDRATFTPAESAVILEIANQAYRAGIEVGAAPAPSFMPENVVPIR
jgi:hypothetical protein